MACWRNTSWGGFSRELFLDVPVRQKLAPGAAPTKKRLWVAPAGGQPAEAEVVFRPASLTAYIAAP